MEGTTVNRTVPSIVGSPDTTSDSLIVGLIICILIILIALIAVAIGYWYYRCRHRRNRPRSPRVRFAPIATVFGEEDDRLQGTPSANNDGVSYYLCLIKGAIGNRIYASDTKLQGATCSTGGEADPEMQDNNRTPRRQTL